MYGPTRNANVIDVYKVNLTKYWKKSWLLLLPSKLTLNPRVEHCTSALNCSECLLTNRKTEVPFFKHEYQISKFKVKEVTRTFFYYFYRIKRFIQHRYTNFQAQIRIFIIWGFSRSNMNLTFFRYFYWNQHIKKHWKALLNLHL